MDDDLHPGTPDSYVAEVSSDMQQLDDLAVDQHVAVFELAHAKLRGLLTDQGHLSQPSPGTPGS